MTTTILKAALAAAVALVAGDAQARNEPAWEAHWAQGRASGHISCTVEHVLPGNALLQVVRFIDADDRGAEFITIIDGHGTVWKTIYVLGGDQRFSGEDGWILMTSELIGAFWSEALRDGGRIYVGWSTTSGYRETDVPLVGFSATYDQCTAALERLRREAGR